MYEQGRDAVVVVSLELSAQNARLVAQVEQLTARVARQDERIATHGAPGQAFVAELLTAAERSAAE